MTGVPQAVQLWVFVFFLFVCFSLEDFLAEKKNRIRIFIIHIKAIAPPAEETAVRCLVK